MDYTKSIACEEIDKVNIELFHLSNKIWKLAETGREVTKSVKSITKFLKNQDFKVTLNFKGIPTAFKAVYTLPSSKPCCHKKPTVALLCRYDAVSKHGHIHGNNLVTEVAVAASLGIKAAIERSCPSAGTVTVIGCPNSVKGGVVPLVNRNAFKDVDVVLMAVPGPRTDWCPVYLGRKTFNAVFKEGERKTKAETIRPKGIDGAMVAYQNLMMVQSHFADGWQAKVTVGGSPVAAKSTEDRTMSNGHTRICLKTPTNGDMHLMEQRVSPCVTAAAHALGCQMDTSLSHKTFYSFVNNKQLCYLLQLNAYHCGTLATPLKAKPILEPIDVANVSHVVPTICPMFYIGLDEDVGTPEFKAAVRTQTAQTYTIAMAKALAMTAVDVFNSPATLLDVTADLRNSLAEEKNTTFKPFPESTLPSYRLKIDMPYDGNIGWSKQT